SVIVVPNQAEGRAMRGRQSDQGAMLAFVDPETRIPADHPIRTIRRLADAALAELSPLFDQMYAQIGRTSIPPERLLKSSALIEAAASLKSFRPTSTDGDDAPPTDPGNPTVNFRGEKRSNTTHASTTDPESRLAKKGKGKEARLSFAAHALMENRHGLLVDFQ